MSERMRVLIVSPEATPFARSGGLGDAVAALATALRARGIDVRLVMPRYGCIDASTLGRRPAPLQVPTAGQPLPCAVFETRLGEVPVYLIEHDALFDRPHLYGPPGHDYDDNLRRFATLCRGALALCLQLEWFPHLFHGHDWPAALLPVYLNTTVQSTPLAGAASLLTIHNLAHQGWFGRARSDEFGLGTAPIEHLGLEADDAINLLKGGILHATLLTTTSPAYAREIQTPSHGEGLQNVLGSRRGDLFGVLNGVDSRWDPATDPLLPSRYSADDLAGKVRCKAELQRAAELPAQPRTPLVGIVGRLVHQKGSDLLVAAFDRLLTLDLQVVLLGTGESWAEHWFAEAAGRRPDRFRAWIAVDERRAHLILGGADLMLVPSRWEPCGLTQMQAQRYGTLPVVRATGGLDDTVDNFDEASGRGTGFKFWDPTPEALLGTVSWATRVYRDNRLAFRAMIDRAMALDHGWDRAAATYDYLYRLATVRRRGG